MILETIKTLDIVSEENREKISEKKLKIIIINNLIDMYNRKEGRERYQK